jgi:hypothetical protein
MALAKDFIVQMLKPPQLAMHPLCNDSAGRDAKIRPTVRFLSILAMVGENELVTGCEAL